MEKIKKQAVICERGQTNKICPMIILTCYMEELSILWNRSWWEDRKQFGEAEVAGVWGTEHQRERSKPERDRKHRSLPRGPLEFLVKSQEQLSRSYTRNNINVLRRSESFRFQPGRMKTFLNEAPERPCCRNKLNLEVQATLDFPLIQIEAKALRGSSLLSSKLTTCQNKFQHFLKK